MNRNQLCQKIPNELGVYNLALSVVDNNGCAEHDNTRVYVVFKKRIFIPSAIKPSSQQLNNRFIHIYADPIMITAINKFEIYDRFGARVFERSQIPVSLELNADFAWDGTIDGEMALPGVYTYYVNVEFVTGRSEVISGAVHLIR